MGELRQSQSHGSCCACRALRLALDFDMDRGERASLRLGPSPRKQVEDQVKLIASCKTAAGTVTPLQFSCPTALDVITEPYQSIQGPMGLYGVLVVTTPPTATYLSAEKLLFCGTLFQSKGKYLYLSMSICGETEPVPHSAERKLLSKYYSVLHSLANLLISMGQNWLIQRLRVTQQQLGPGGQVSMFLVGCSVRRLTCGSLVDVRHIQDALATSHSMQRILCVATGATC